MIKQISIYTENRRGAAREIFSVFAKAGINILSFVSSDSGEFGTMRLIVSDSAAAMAELTRKGYLSKMDSVLAAELEDVPGALENLLAFIEEMNINIHYMYVGYMRENRVPIIILRCDEMGIVEQNLTGKGYTVY